MEVFKYQDTVADSQTGRPCANVIVTVNVSGGGSAILYNQDGTVSSAPVITDADGYFSFYVIVGVYDLHFSIGSIAKTWTGVQIGNSQLILKDTATGKNGTLSGTITGPKDAGGDIWELDVETII